MAQFTDTIHGRIAHVRRTANLTQKAFAHKLDVSQAYISSLEKGKREVSRNVLQGLIEHFNISPDWLMTGKGTQYMEADGMAGMASMPAMMDNQLMVSNLRHPGFRPNLELYMGGERERILPITVNEDNEPNIVLVPVKAQAGYANGRVQTEYMRDLPTFSLPDARFKNGTFRAFEISGDSMEPTLYGSDIVVARSVQDWRWLRDHELYVVVMKEDVLAKRIRNRVRDEQVFELISDNRFYPPFRVPVVEVLEIWQVFARLTLHLPSPGQLQG